MPFEAIRSEGWKAALAAEFSQPYMAALSQFLDAEEASGKPILPPRPLWFHALDATALEAVRVVILGQDPYHGPGQAHGLCFSVRPGVRPPPSLGNIYRELETDLGIPRARHGYLEHWAGQGVLLLNSVLTVEQGKAASHKGKGWERFTDAIIRLVDSGPEPVVFLLWGAYAQRKAAFVDTSHHLVLNAVHPSPLSAYNGFFGCRHFSQANAFLGAHGRGAVDWALPEVLEDDLRRLGPEAPDPQHLLGF